MDPRSIKHKALDGEKGFRRARATYQKPPRPDKQAWLTYRRYAAAASRNHGMPGCDERDAADACQPRNADPPIADVARRTDSEGVAGTRMSGGAFRRGA